MKVGYEKTFISEQLYKSFSLLEAHNPKMAELGYKSCLMALEKKMQQNPAENTIRNYINTLFWYSRFLAFTSDFPDLKAASALTDKLVDQIHRPDVISTSQQVVILYQAAAISMQIKNYNQAITYLSHALVFCESDKKSSNYSEIIIGLAEAHYMHGTHVDAVKCCQMLSDYCKLHPNDEAMQRANELMNKINKT